VNSAAARSAHVCTAAEPAPISVTPRPAIVSEGEHSNQRRFGATQRAAFGLALAHHAATELIVCRMAHEEVASLEVSIGSGHGYGVAVTIDLDLTRSELLELAARLIDAAHDIDTHPSQQLIAAREAARGAT
jgi:hypothetical protein